MKLSAILLAGGKSSRMGTNKALLVRDGVSLLQSTFTNLKSVLPEDAQVLVSGNYEGYPCVLDEKPELGPIEGVWSCTGRLPLGCAVLVTAVDMPLLSPEVLRNLIGHFMTEKKLNPQIQGIQFKNFEMPFIFVLDPETEMILKEVRNLTDSSLRSLRNFKKCLKKIEIEVVEEENFKNVNTPQDWKEVVDSETASKC